ncbi:MAG TPA: succinate dehydrogenase, hydrophobic membrane anchor protein, partial [Methylophaga sp.]|nr:succinate dehydrogenase, hydrophobic membrane anchor protein [Methylophaga sp.]
LVPLTIWLAFSIALIPEASYENVLAWFSSTWNATLAISFLIATFYHAALGMQIVYEDYIHKECAKVAMVVGTQLAMALLAIGSVVAVLKLAVGG